MSIGEIINVVLIGILVVTTIYYAIQNKGMRDEMKKDRELATETMQRSIKPYIIIKSLLVNTGFKGGGLSKKGDYCQRFYEPLVELEVENIGLGHAIDVNINAKVVFEWKLPNGTSVKRLFHFSNTPDPSIYPVWVKTIPSGSGIQKIRLNVSNSEPVPATFTQGIECRLSCVNILGEKVEYEPICSYSSRCQVEIDEVCPTYKLVLGGEEVEVEC